MIHRFVRFGIVGASGLFIDFSITWICKEWFLFHPLFSNAVGFSVAVCSNYFLNKGWTFNNNSSNIGRQMTIFWSISLIGLSLNTLLLSISDHLFALPFYLNKAIATFFVMFWNFFANNFITFKK
jgi:dolichol-phosphate mannosyltransferase